MRIILPRLSNIDCYGNVKGPGQSPEENTEENTEEKGRRKLSTRRQSGCQTIAEGRC